MSLWAKIAGTAAIITGVAAGVTVWAMQPQSDAPPESKGASATRKAPEEAQGTNALLQTALKQQQEQNLRGATRTYRRVLELDPHNKFAWYGLGIIAQQNDMTADAVAAYDKALQLDPSFMSALFSEATLLRSSDPDRATRLLKRAADADPKATAIQMQLGLLLAGRGRNDEAEDAFRRAVAANPSLLSHVPEQFRDSVSPSPTSSQSGNSR